MEDKQPLQTTQPATPQVPTPPDPTPTPMDNLPNTSPPPRHIPKAAILIIVFLILCALSFVGIYIFKIISANNVVLLPTPSPTPTLPPAGGPTTDWKTYVSPENNFLFKYRSDLTITKNSAAETIWQAEFNPGEVYESFLVLSSQDTPFPPPEIKDPQTQSIDKNETVLIDGTEVQKYSYTCGIHCYYVLIEFKSNNKYYQLKQNAAGGGRSSLFDQILSTFKFLDQTNMKTYTNDSYQIQYPSTWIVESTFTGTNLINNESSILVFNGEGPLGFDGPSEKRTLMVGTENEEFYYYGFDQKQNAYNGGTITNPKTNISVGFFIRIPKVNEAAAISEVQKILSTFKFTDSISPTCVPRPACLDATPRCLIPETPDMCPSKASITPQQIACTQEAKLCPDGSYVSRTGPNCAFAACP